MPQNQSTRPAASPWIVLDLDADAAGEVLTLRRAAFLAAGAEHDDYAIPPLVEPLDAVRAELTDPASRTLGVREGGRLLASVTLRPLGGGAVELIRFAVVPDRQGEGLGSHLLRAAEAAFPAARAIRLATGEHSIATLTLYERNGYVRTGRTPVGGYDLIHLAKTLR